VSNPINARLFVAVWPPDEVVEAVAALDRPEMVGLRWTDRRQWHVTLRFLGRCDIVDARRALDRLVVPAVAVEARLGPAVGHFGRQVVQVPVLGLEDLATAVVAATADVGEPPDDRPFAGHLTLARVATRADIDVGGLTGQAVTARWPVTDLTLVESRLSSAGAAYRVLASWP